MNLEEEANFVRDMAIKNNEFFGECLPMIASENILSPMCQEMLITDFHGRYAEGTPGQRYYQGCKYFDEVEYSEIYENEYGSGKCIFIITPIGRHYMWAAAQWGEYGDEGEAEYWRDRFMQLTEKIDIFVSFEINGDTIVIPYIDGNENMLRMLNFKGIENGNAVPETQHIRVTVHDNVADASLLNFMGDWSSPEITHRGNETIISFDLHTQCCMVYETNETVLYASVVKPRAGKIYLADREIMPLYSNRIIIIGKITIKVDAHGESEIDKVEFYIDDELKSSDAQTPYEWLWDEFAIGTHEIKVITYDNKGNEASDEINVTIFNL